MEGGVYMAVKVKLSVGNLVGFVLRGGSIDNRFSGLDRAAQGSRIHRKLQKEAPDGYMAEVTLRNTQMYNDIEYTVEGRADGLFEENSMPVIDEIKTTTAPIEAITEDFNMAHWGQGQCYAYFYCVKYGLEKAAVRLTYFQVDEEEIIRFQKEYSFAELEEIYIGFLQRYEKWAAFMVSWKTTRDDSIKELDFPFETYRKGQRELAVSVYKAIVQSSNFFCQAPTGIGKTMSTLYPAMKAMAEGYEEKVFYLTAKTITRTAAQEALRFMQQKGLRAKYVTITAKDKVCFLEERNCNPDACPYAKGYFDRVNDVVLAQLQEKDTFTRQEIEQIAKEHTLCPFELALDFSLWCDVVICDYNYLFDPEAMLQRFFSDSTGQYVFLIDEAHNLPDRVRAMYSASISKKEVLAVKKAIGKKEKRFTQALQKVNTALLDVRKECEENNAVFLVEETPRKEHVTLLRGLLKEYERYLEKYKNNLEDGVLETYFSLRFFLKITELYDESYATFYEVSKYDVTMKLLCLDPAVFVQAAFEKGRAAVLFSATFSPLPFYMEVLGNDEDAKKASFSSPFQQENLALLVESSVSTKYKDRAFTLTEVAESIAAFASVKKGNYIVYFPSYKYMGQVLEAFDTLHTGIKVTCQQSNISEEEREAFLKLFDDPDNHVLAFCVMGGMFAEGVDLVGDKLQGCCIVGVGLPQINPEIELIKRHYDDKNNNGYAYAYRYPGMNKVLQAAGRVIRTEQDKGVVLLIDSRFGTREYRALFPSYWSHARRVHGTKEITEAIETFWNANF